MIRSAVLVLLAVRTSDLRKYLLKDLRTQDFLSAMESSAPWQVETTGTLIAFLTASPKAP